MIPRWPQWAKPELVALALLLAYPLIPLPHGFGKQLADIFVFAILALGLNVVVGYTGLLNLGIAAFFGIGAYITGIAMATSYPFQYGFAPALLLAVLGAAAAGLMLGAPTLRLRGDYLALVTLGFGEVVKYSLRNLDEITNGTRGIGPIPPPPVGTPLFWQQNFWPFYYLNLAFLVVVVLLLKNLENSRLGRAWMAIREDELAATCMGVNAARIKLSAFAMGAGLAGLAGCLYAVTQGSTAQPDAYDFNRSMMMLCCIILGGLGSIRGTLLGVLLLIGFDTVFAPLVDDWFQRSWFRGVELLKFSNWRFMIFGLALILMMRFRPEGLWPSSRVKEEMHEEK